MKRTDRPAVNIIGDNNEVNVSLGKTNAYRIAIIIALGLIGGAVILAVSHCCPELLAEFVRSVISLAGGG